MPFLILYYNVSLGMDNYVLIMAPAILIAAASTVLLGKMYDKLHFKASVIPAIALMMAGDLLLFFFKNIPVVFIGSVFLLSGFLSGMAVFGAMIRDHTPQGRAGMFQGLRIVCQVLIPGIIGPYIGALILRNAEVITNSDGTTSFIPNQNIWLGAFIAAIALCATLVWMFKLLSKENQRAK